MRIAVSGKNIDVGAALQEYVKTNLDGAVSKYFPDAVSADVVITKERHLFVTNILVNEGTDPHLIIKSTGDADEVHASIEKAVEKVEKQLRRYKKRIRNHHHQRVGKTVDSAQYEASKFVLASEEEKEDDSGDNPIIIAEKKTRIETLTVSEAVMRMDLADLPAYVFINKLNNNVNVVYRRVDGNISWIDSGVATSSKSSAA